MKRPWPWVLAAALALMTPFAPAGTSCKKDLNAKKEGDSCLTHTECGPGLVCDCSTRTCLPQGQGNVQCELPDAGWPDASVIDAAVYEDAAILDAETTDASVLDATVPDAETTDASVVDGAAPDASPQDAETVDASP